MKKVSSKMSKINNEYSKLRKEYLIEHQMCHAKIYNCSLRATDVHHKKGRGKYHLDVGTWMPVCRSCHNWIEEHPEESKDLGFSISKIK
jgi:arylamine N-acetyltransferase